MLGEKEIKCVVWDLDETIWDGTLLESQSVVLKPGVKEVIQTLDSRGILHSIASRNSHEVAMGKLNEYGLGDYFLYPQITWNTKSTSLTQIREKLNIAFDAMLFIDDQPFERDEVRHHHPDVWCIPASEYERLPLHGRLNPRFVTEDSRRRRQMYVDDLHRTQDEKDCKGPASEFLGSLGMRFYISVATENDLERAEELTRRTHQINATGRTYDYDELNAFRQSPNHLLLTCKLEDRYGSYGSIGLALLEVQATYNHLRLLLMSCRVMSRGVGTILLHHLMRMTKNQGKSLLADFKPTETNRAMYVSYKFANFVERQTCDDGLILMENALDVVPGFPRHVEIVAPPFMEWLS